MEGRVILGALRLRCLQFRQRSRETAKRAPPPASPDGLSQPRAIEIDHVHRRGALGAAHENVADVQIAVMQTAVGSSGQIAGHDENVPVSVFQSTVPLARSRAITKGWSEPSQLKIKALSVRMGAPPLP